MLKTNEIQYIFNSEEKTVVAFIENTEFDAVKDFLKAIFLGDMCVATIDFNSLSRKYRMQKKYVSIVKMDAYSNLSFAAFKALAMRRLYHAYDKDYQRCIANLRLHLEFSVEALKDREIIVKNYLESYETFKVRFRLMRSNHTSPNHKINNAPENSHKERHLHEKAKALSDNPSVKSPTQIFCENVNECMKEINTKINNHTNTEINNHKEENPTLEMKAKGEMNDKSADKKVDASMLAFEVLAVTIRKSDRSIVNSDSLYELYVALMCTLNMPYITRVEFTHKMITRVFIDSPFAVGYVCDDKSVIFKGIELCKLGFLNYVWSKKLSDEDKRRIEALWDHVYVRDTAKLPSTFDASRAIPVNKIYYSLYTNKRNPSRLSVPNKDLLNMTFSEVIESIFKDDKFIKGI